jgi:hypothetical protein
MNNLAKLGIALLLAIIAGVLNVVYLHLRERPTLYLALGDAPVKAGQPFPTEDNKYKPLPIPGGVVAPETTFIAWDNRAIVFGLRAKRDLDVGDPIFQGDIAQAVPRYETLGPFKLLSVGEHLTGTVETDRSSGGASAITVEPLFVHPASGEEGNSDALKYNETTSRLLEIIDEQRRGGDRAASHLRIVAIESVQDPLSADESEVGRANSPGGRSSELLRSTPRAIIVAIDRVATIPKVLQIGARVGFVVPAYP